MPASLRSCRYQWDGPPLTAFSFCTLYWTARSPKPLAETAVTPHSARETSSRDSLGIGRRRSLLTLGRTGLPRTHGNPARIPGALSKRRSGANVLKRGGCRWIQTLVRISDSPETQSETAVTLNISPETFDRKLWQNGRCASLAR